MSDNSPDPEQPPRRGFLAGAAALALGAAAAAAPIFAGMAVVLDPLRRRLGSRDLVHVTNLSVLPDDGVPRKFTVQADRTDAWNTHRNVPVGAVYVRRTPAGVQALNVVCPHAGCFVGLAPDESQFRCPCHKSSFALDGSINDPSSPSPRDMDELEVEVRDGGEVWVRFQNFQSGRPEKTPVQ